MNVMGSVGSTPAAVTDFGHSLRLRMSSEATGGVFAVAEVVVQPGGSVPLHIHDREEETFYVREGRFVFLVGDDVLEAGPNDTVFGPRRMPHAWRCVSDTPGRFLVVITPGENFEAYARETRETLYYPIL